jgi:hypothetical protein
MTAFTNSRCALFANHGLFKLLLDPRYVKTKTSALGAIRRRRTALRGHALPDMPTETGGYGTRKPGIDYAAIHTSYGWNNEWRK